MRYEFNPIPEQTIDNNGQGAVKQASTPMSLIQLLKEKPHDHTLPGDLYTEVREAVITIYADTYSRVPLPKETKERLLVGIGQHMDTLAYTIWNACDVYHSSKVARRVQFQAFSNLQRTVWAANELYRSGIGFSSPKPIRLLNETDKEYSA